MDVIILVCNMCMFNVVTLAMSPVETCGWTKQIKNNLHYKVETCRFTMLQYKWCCPIDFKHGMVTPLVIRFILERAATL